MQASKMRKDAAQAMASITDVSPAHRTLVLQVGTCITEVGSWLEVLLQEQKLLPGLIGDCSTTMVSTV